MTFYRFASAAVLPVVLWLPAAAQQPAKAGEKRPNVQVLKDLPESQLFLVMNLISDSLGVRCDHCHVQEKPDTTKTPSNVGGWVWDRDDKLPKRTAREMMRMVVALNNERFKDAPRVTCYTCHRGSTQPERTPPLPPAAGAAVTPTAPRLPSADRLWANYLNAVGASDGAAIGSGIIITGWDERPEGRYGRVEITLAGNDRYHLALTNADSVIRQGFLGDNGWVATKDGVQKVSAGDLDRLRRVAMRYRPIKDRPAGLKVVGIERLSDRDVYVAIAKVNPTTTLTLYFDTATGLLRRELTTTETMLLPLEEQTDYEDYRDVDGVQMPFRVRTSDGAPYDTATKTFLQIRRNVAVEDAVFRPPEAAASQNQK
jgi:hypothetical protein